MEEIGGTLVVVPALGAVVKVEDVLWIFDEIGDISADSHGISGVSEDDKDVVIDIGELSMDNVHKNDLNRVTDWTEGLHAVSEIVHCGLVDHIIWVETLAVILGLIEEGNSGHDVGHQGDHVTSLDIVNDLWNCGSDLADIR